MPSPENTQQEESTNIDAMLSDQFDALEKLEEEEQTPVET